MDIIKAIFECFTGINFTSSDMDTVLLRGTNEEHDKLDVDMINILLTADSPGEAHKKVVIRTIDLVHTEGSYDGLAKPILHHVQAALKSQKAMGKAMKEAFDKAQKGAEEFVKEHPVLATAIITVVALSIIAALLPWVIDALGFAARGPVRGKSIDRVYSDA